MSTSSTAKQAVLSALRSSTEPLTLAQIAVAAGIPTNRAGVLARELEAACMVRQVGTTRPIRYTSTEQALGIPSPFISPYLAGSSESIAARRADINALFTEAADAPTE